ncbi:MAG TPA: CHAT domain-containing protein, partial [Gemmatimonadales bacterium]
DRILLAELAGMSGDIRASRAAIREADQVADRIGAPQAHRELALGEARLADRADDPRRVLRALRRPGAAWASAPFPLQAEAAELAARSYAAIGQLDSAVDQGRRAVYAIERVRGAYRSGPLQTHYLSDRAGVYADLARVLLQQKRIEEAFEVADAARGRALLEHITEQGDSGSRMDGVAQLALAERKLRRFAGLKEQLAVAEAEAQPADTSAQATLAVLRSVTDSMQRQYQLASAAANELPPSAAVLGAAQPHVMAIQRSLRPGEVLLEYLASDQELLIFGVSHTKINHARVPVRGTVLASRVRLARELLAGSHEDPALARPVLTALYSDLIAPAGEWLDGAETLLVATHGVLSYLPFAALRDSLSGQYLAETKTIVHVPSGAGLAALRDRGSRAGGAALHSGAGFAFAPLPDALRASGDEVQAVGRYASARVVVGGRATETAVRKALAAGGLIHIASHGYMNSGNPMNSRLALRPTGNSGAEDGWLEVHEVLGLTIASPLLFLSGCETGLGGAWSTSFAPGDDFVTLAQAFLHAGAENVVGTLWRVQDRAAAEFAGAFYQALQSSDPAAALAQAQRAMLREQAFAHPYHWAGYRITGSALGPAGRKFRAGVRLSIETGSAHLPPSISSFRPGIP